MQNISPSLLLWSHHCHHNCPTASSQRTLMSSPRLSGSRTHSYLRFSKKPYYLSCQKSLPCSHSNIFESNEISYKWHSKASTSCQVIDLNDCWRTLQPKPSRGRSTSPIFQTQSVKPDSPGVFWFNTSEGLNILRESRCSQFSRNTERACSQRRPDFRFSSW